MTNTTQAPTRAPRITDLDFDSPEWKRMREFYSSRRAELIVMLSKPYIPEREADMIRGGIRELDAMLALDERRKVLPSDIYTP